MVGYGSMDEQAPVPNPPETGETTPPPTEPTAASPLSALKRIFGPILAALAAGWKYLLIALKVLPFGKVLLTGGSMLLSIWWYASEFGFPFAVGFVVCILVHELGHVFFAWQLGVPVSAPLFIPGMGALITQKRHASSAYHEALIGIGGPVFGTLSGIGCWAIYAATDNRLFLGLAFVTFFLNLFNLAPIYPLDGGWIVACLSPYLLVFGYALLILGTITGYIQNPVIFILVLLSIPRVIQMFKRGNADTGVLKTTSRQRWGMGAAYLVLIVLLTWSMGHLHIKGEDVRPKQSHSQVAFR